MFVCMCVSRYIYANVLLVGGSRRNLKVQRFFGNVKMQKSHVKNIWYQTINTFKERDLKPTQES